MSGWEVLAGERVMDEAKTRLAETLGRHQELRIHAMTPGATADIGFFAGWAMGRRAVHVPADEEAREQGTAVRFRHGDADGVVIAEWSGQPTSKRAVLVGGIVPTARGVYLELVGDMPSDVVAFEAVYRPPVEEPPAEEETEEPAPEPLPTRRRRRPPPLQPAPQQHPYHAAIEESIKANWPGPIVVGGQAVNVASDLVEAVLGTAEFVRRRDAALAEAPKGDGVDHHPRPSGRVPDLPSQPVTRPGA